MNKTIIQLKTGGLLVLTDSSKAFWHEDRVVIYHSNKYGQRCKTAIALEEVVYITEKDESSQR